MVHFHPIGDVLCEAAPQSWESALKSQGQVETKIFPHMLPHCAVHYGPTAISKIVANFCHLIVHETWVWKLLTSKTTLGWATWWFSPRCFSPRLFSPAVSAPRLFSPKTFQPQDFSAPRLFSPKMFQPQDFSAPNFFSPRPFSPKTFQPQDFSAPRLFSPWTFQPQMFQPLLFFIENMKFHAN